MKYKIGQKVKIIVSDVELVKIAIFVDADWTHHDMYSDRTKLYTITDIDKTPTHIYGGLFCPYQLDNYSYFPENYFKLEDREKKLERILK
jgi:hypothetical protein